MVSIRTLHLCQNLKTENLVRKHKTALDLYMFMHQAQNSVMARLHLTLVLDEISGA